MPHSDQIIEMIRRSNDIFNGLIQMSQVVVKHEEYRKINGQQLHEQGSRAEVQEMSLRGEDSKHHITGKNKQRRRVC